MKPIILCYLFIQETYYANVLHLGAPLLVFQYHSPPNTFITPLTDSSGMPFFLFQHLIFSNTFPAFHSNNQSTFLRSLRSQQTFFFFLSIQPEVTSCLHQALLFCPTIGFGSINSCLCLVLSFRYSQRYASTSCVSVFSLMHQMCLQIMPTPFFLISLPNKEIFTSQTALPSRFALFTTLSSIKFGGKKMLPV